MGTKYDFETLMTKVGNMARELEYPPINPTIKREDVIEVFKDIRSFFGSKSYIVNGGDIDEVVEELKKAQNMVSNILKETEEETTKKLAKKALSKLEFIEDPLLEKI